MERGLQINPMKTLEEELLDWRLNVSVVVTKDNPNLGVKKGARGTTSSVFKYENKELMFNLPSGTALFLEFALNQYEKSLELRFKSLTEVVEAHIKNENVYPYFECLASSFVFSMIALESFANVSIPNKFYHEKKNKKIWAALGKDNIERAIETDIKIGDILPKIFDKPTVKGTEIWKDYLKLKTIRDRLVHLKSKDLESISPKHDSIWDNLLKVEFGSPVKIIMSIINHYIGDEKSRQPWWYQNAPSKITTG